MSMESAEQSMFDTVQYRVGNDGLAARFGHPPFSILDSSGGDWQRRKRQWLAVGIESELGRADSGYASLPSNILENDSYAGFDKLAAVSVFDPVLCELAYRWWCPPKGHVFDPFAGGSVRGVVAGSMGRSYTGTELRQEQVEANREQWDRIGPTFPAAGNVRWAQGDARHAQTVLGYQGVEQFDFIWSCPPYHDLEVYSDDPADLSNMPWDAFVNGYYQVIEQAVQMLRPNRFAAWVIGDIRDRKTGHLRNLHGLTTEAFEAAGARFYNDAILQTPVGTLAVRSGSAKSGFGATRKIGRRHQYVLVYVKGDSREAVKALDENVDELPT